MNVATARVAKKAETVTRRARPAAPVARRDEAARTRPVPGLPHGLNVADLAIHPATASPRPSFSAAPFGIQCKLHVGGVADPLEREADRVADHVMRMPDPAAPSALALSGANRAGVQRACAGCRDDERPDAKHAKRASDDDLIHGKLTGTPAPIGAELEHRIRSLDGGEPLPVEERAFFEPRFGYDFSKVRIHAGPVAADAAHQISARAFTFGRDVVFSAGSYAPGTQTGRHLLAHELAHVAQQGAGESASVQREFVTPAPVPAPGAQPPLTKAQIATALAFNKLRYNAASTKEIQRLVGTGGNGTFTEDDIVAIAGVQESFGLKKDGIIGPDTFRLLDKEITAEKLPTTDDNCLVSFAVIGSPVKVSPVVGGQRTISSTFKMHALLPKHCTCSDYVYRQFIKGHWKRIRGGVTTDLGNTFSTEPGGVGLPPAFIEDGNTSAAALNYGHREQTPEKINHYLNDAGKEDQANGCRYEGEDTPGGPDSVLSGDVFDINVQFKGEIRRKGRVVDSKEWIAIRGKFPVP